MAYWEVLFKDLDSLGTVMLVKGGGLRELKMADGLMADGLVEAENRNGSGLTTGILEAGSTGARTLPMASNKVLLWKLVDTDLTFCQLRLLGHLSSTPVAERFGWPQWPQI